MEESKDYLSARYRKGDPRAEKWLSDALVLCMSKRWTYTLISGDGWWELRIHRRHFDGLGV